MTLGQTSGHSHNPDIPSSNQIIWRESLQRKLKEVWYFRLTLVNAPPGYGKTTAVARFARECEVPIAWHTLDENERDLPNLFNHSLRALRRAVPGIDDVNHLQLITPQDHATYLANYIRQHQPEPMLYVLDDLQLIVGAQSAEQWLQALVQLLPNNCHIVLISRLLPDLPLAELIARGDVLAIGQEQLKFKPEDAQALSLLADHGISEVEIRQRIEQLEGWPAGVAVALRPLPQDIEAQMLGGGGGPEALFEVLANTMLQRQSPILRDFLLSSSVLSRITPETCREVLDIDNSTTHIDSVLRRNLFASRASGGLTYHRLFRDFLQRVLADTHPQRYVTLHEKAGDWFWQNNDPDEAINHYLSAESVDNALKIIEQIQREYFNQGKTETLIRWRLALEDDATRSPQLMYTCAMIYTDQYLYAAAESDLDAAEKGFTERDDRTGMTNVQLQRALIALRQGDTQSVIQQIESLGLDDTVPRTVHARSQHLLGLAYLNQGAANKAIELFERIVPVFEEAMDVYALSFLLQDLDVAYQRVGRIEEASACLQRVVTLRRKLGRPDALALALNNLGYLYHQQGNYQQAFEAFKEGLSIVSQTSDRRAESYLLWSIGDLNRDTGMFDAASRHYNRAYELSSQSERALQRDVIWSMVTLYRWQNNLNLAQRLATEALQFFNAGDESPGKLIAEANLIAASEHPKAEDFVRLGEIEEALGEMNAISEQSHVRGITALVALRKNDTSAATKALNTVDHIAHALVAEIVHNALLLNFVKDTSKNKKLLSAVNTLVDYQEAPSRTVADNTPTYTLRVTTLGQETFECNGDNVAASDWRANRAREFFHFLLFEGPQRREDICLAFWPDSSASSVRSNFHTTLHRTRRALGENVILYAQDRYQINSQVDVWCDALEMQALVKQARLLPYQDARTDDLWRRAIELYGGEFLPSIDAEWTYSWRSKLNDAYIEALLGASRCAQARGDFNDALTLAQRVFEIDPYREEAYRAIFYSYAQLGEQRQILLHFKNMKQLFDSDLGVGPSSETISLIQQLTGYQIVYQRTI